MAFGDLEAAVMDHLWSRGQPAAVRDVQDALAPERPLAYTTLMTVLDRLHRKGWLTRELDGRAYVYRPAGTREDYSSGLMAEALDTSADRAATLVHFFQQLNPEEARLLRVVLDGRTGLSRRRKK